MDMKLEKIVDEKKKIQFLNYLGIAFTSSTHSQILFKKKTMPSLSRICEKRRVGLRCH
jgi:hypothetical protein